MTYQDELLNNLINLLESAVIAHIKHPCILNAQKVANAKHEIHKFIKNVSGRGVKPMEIK